MHILYNFLCFIICLSGSSKTDVSKDSTLDQCSKSDNIEKNKDCNNSTIDIKIENPPLSNGQDSVIVENGTIELNENEQVDSIESEVDIKENCLSEEKENETFGNLSVVEVCSSENSCKPLRIDDSVILEQTSKKDIRQKVWEFMEENKLVVFPKPCFNRIPNFKGCINATQMLEKLVEFKKAKTVQVTPDKAQETARYLTLSVSCYFF